MHVTAFPCASLAAARERRSYFANLRRVPRLVGADEREPLVAVDRSEERVRVADGRDRDAIIGGQQFAQLATGGLEGGECRGGVHLPAWEHAVAGGDSPSAVENDAVGCRVDDRARVGFRSEGAGRVGLGQLCGEEARELLLD
jgi:hypothetical protein